MCLQTQSGSINMCDKETGVAWCGTVLAHEMGHSFGMMHDDGDATASDPPGLDDCPSSGFIMAAVSYAG